MSAVSYYNEFDPFAAQWLRNLISAGLIAPGEVDERSILDVTPDDLKGFTQCHFFAGIAGWSLALRLAGWPDDKPVWTGSCPCQPFSAAGKKKGFKDERHLWPAFFSLIKDWRPSTVFGEQVASPDALAWWDAVQDDLEREGYACGAADLCAAGVGAPHIRQRLFWVADRDDKPKRSATECNGTDQIGRRREVGGMVNGFDKGLERLPWDGNDKAGRSLKTGPVTKAGDACRVEYGNGGGCKRREESERNDDDGDKVGRAQGEYGSSQSMSCRLSGYPAGPLAGFWGNADWLLCRDERFRPVEPCTFPLADGVPGRVGRIRAYGNAIVPQVAAEFIGACLECEP